MSVDGATIHIEDYLPAGTVRDNLILVHGFGGSTYSWINNTSAFVYAGYRVTAVDMKGFGLSTKDLGSSYSHATQASILASVAKQLGIDSAVFIAHSMGASVILHLVETAPQLVKGMILVDGQVSFKKPFPVSRSLVFDPIGRAFQNVISCYLTKARLAGILKTAYYQPAKLSDADIAEYYSRNVYGNWPDSLIAMTRDSSENAVDFRISKYIPTLVIWGDKDTWVGRTMAEQIAAYTGGELKLIPNAGHLSMEEAPDVFNSMVIEFLSQISNYKGIT
jgi:pimeloyl-ACP methyl ester carboxylesterase